jgi:AcrR family transcriptional regulator
VRERTQLAIRNELTAAAVQLFSEHGFAETTGRQIAEAVGVSERTFFRYYASKEDVILGALDELGAQLASRLAARPAHEAPFRALRRSFDLIPKFWPTSPNGR